MTTQIKELETKIMELKAELNKARQEAEPEKVQDYPFEGPDGSVSLSELFGDKDDLLVVHNMGASCNYCTLWADGFESIYRHIEGRCAFVLASPDAPDEQAKVAKARGWTYRIVSDATSDFTTAMGYKPDDSYWPGVSAFHREEDGSIVRTGTAIFGPGDDFCPTWHFFDLLRDGAKGWEPS